MTTDVSSRPRGIRLSDTRRNALVGNGVEIGRQPFCVDRRRATKERNSELGSDETVTTHWREFRDRHAIPGDHERFAFVESAHDLAALIAKLSL